jgi:hypothetical protein
MHGGMPAACCNRSVPFYCGQRDLVDFAIADSDGQNTTFMAGVDFPLDGIVPKVSHRSTIAIAALRRL